MPDRETYLKQLLGEICAESKPRNVMEVCGTHTMAIAQSGIRELLPANIKLLSGPGCPVCVTAQGDIDAVIHLARDPAVTLVTFGDMMRVPGSQSSLSEERGRGADVRVTYSPLDALRLARELPEREIVLLGIGFETTAPTVAAVLEQAVADGLKNFSVFSLHKTVPPALDLLFADPDIRAEALICPGHVAAVTGVAPFARLAAAQGKACVITGFETGDILEGLVMLLRQLQTGRPRAEIQYRRVVKADGNPVARRLMDSVFEPAAARWRGLGAIEGSGLKLRPAYAAYDARRRFAVPDLPDTPIKGCRCGDILCGKAEPPDCPLFALGCTPLRPVGPCMVSHEGSCAAWYRYRRVINV